MMTMMKSCQDVETIMTAYVDGEATIEETAGVEAHLAVCEPCRERATAEKTVRHVLHARARSLGERASQALRARCVAVVPVGAEQPDGARGAWGRRVMGWVPLSMAATVLLAVGAVFIFGQNQQLEAAFAAQLAIDHERCFTDLDDVVVGFNETHARRILTEDLGISAFVPAESADFNVVDVRQCFYDGGGMVHVLCEWRGEPVSLFFVPGRSDREQHLEIVGHDAVIWSEGENANVLVAEHGSVEIGQVAEYVRRRTY